MRGMDLWSPLDASFSRSRAQLHQLAFFAVSPARYKEVGRMGLRPTPGGFGTPEFAGSVARVEGSLLVMEKEGNVATREISTVRDAAEFFSGSYTPDWFGDFHDPLNPIDPDSSLDIADDDTLLLGSWFEFGFAVLGNLIGSVGADSEASEPQIWPEHFDAAAELGPADEGQRAGYGASPGDGNIPQPYLYVAPWGEFDKSDGYWNATSFTGSFIRYDVLSAADDPFDLALEFFRSGYSRLQG